jgi:hypothetical protein
MLKCYRNIEKINSYINFINVEVKKIMHPIISKCPVCNDDLIVARLYCPNCATAIEGRFNLGRFAQLDQQKLDFVETFIRCEGKLTRVQDELGISYPTVRNRLEEVIMALGYEVEKPETSPLPVSDEERRAILADLAAGRITSEEAMRMLQGKGIEPESEEEQ